MKIEITTIVNGAIVSTETRFVSSDNLFRQLQVWFGKCTGTISYDNGVSTRLMGWTFKRGNIEVWVERFPEPEAGLSLLEVFDGAAHVDDFVIWSSFPGGLAQITDLMLHSQLAVPQYDTIKWSYYGQI